MLTICVEWQRSRGHAVVNGAVVGKGRTGEGSLEGRSRHRWRRCCWIGWGCFDAGRAVGLLDRQASTRACW